MSAPAPLTLTEGAAPESHTGAGHVGIVKCSVCVRDGAGTPKRVRTTHPRPTREGLVRTAKCSVRQRRSTRLDVTRPYTRFQGQRQKSNPRLRPLDISTDSTHWRQWTGRLSTATRAESSGGATGTEVLVLGSGSGSGSGGSGSGSEGQVIRREN